MWFDSSGILYANTKDVFRTLQIQKEAYEYIREITGGNKVCLLSNPSSSNPLDKETQEYMEREQPSLFKAIAVISETVRGEIISKNFLKLQKPSIPINFFNDEKEAKEWLKRYL